MSLYKDILLHPKKDEFLKRFHPWVFSGAIAREPDSLVEGEIVRVLASDRTFLGVGHYQVGSIAVRILSFSDEVIDRAFYERRLTTAYRLREELRLIHPDNNIFRLVHGEGDNLPGLIVDIYGKTAVMQAHSVGIHADRSVIAEALLSVLSVVNIENLFYKSKGTLPYKAGIEAEDLYLAGGKDVNEVGIENGFTFHIDWLKGQKTGFFIDQRDNRTLLEHYSSGRSVLNMFCYTGAFSVYALRGGAHRVDSLDSSSKAVSIAGQNILANFGEEQRHTSHVGDAFKFLQEADAGTYDLIVVDPPAFAKHRGAINNALQGYKKLNQLAIEKIAPGGILFSFSCSQVIQKEQFRLALFSAAAITGRKVRVLHQLSQPADHPINIYHPEGEYLKGLVLHVE